MSLMIAAAVLPLIPVAADDARFDAPRTYVSPNAEASLDAGEDAVLCLDRPRRERYRAICLTRAEWEQAIDLAEAAPKRGPRALVPWNYPAGGNTQSALYGRGR